MRFALFAAAGACVLLAGCGSQETNQARHDPAAASQPSPPATGHTMVLLAAAPNKDAALKIMHERHEGMETIGKANKAIRRELGSNAPDLATVRAGAAEIADLSRKASRWFPRGTGPELGKTGAKPEIWQSPRDFVAKLHNFQAAAKTFNEAAMTGDVNVIKPKFGELGQTCKACHDKYRSEMHH